MPGNRWLQVSTALLLCIITCVTLLSVRGQDDPLVVKVALLLMRDDLQESPDIYIRPVLAAAADSVLDNYGVEMQFLTDFPMITACANSSGSPAVSRTFIKVFNYYQEKADVVIGPYCAAKLAPSGIATSALNILQVTGGCHSVLDISSYTYLTRTGYVKMNQFGLIKYMLEKYQWSTLMVLYEKDSAERLGDYQAFAARDTENTNFTGTYLAITSASLSTSKIRDVLTAVGRSARVVVLLMDNVIIRRVMIEAAKMDMVGGDYVYFAVDILGSEMTRNNSTNGWRDDSDTPDNNDLAKKAYASLLVVSLRDRSDNPVYQENLAAIYEKAKDSSLYGGSGPYQLPYSAESFYNSLVFVADVIVKMDVDQQDINAHNITLTTVDNYDNGPDDWLVTHGLYGDFYIDAHTGDIEESYQLYAMTDANAGHFTGLLVSEGAEGTLNVTTLNPSFTWTTSDGSFPPNQPPCGYTGDDPACAAQTNGQIAGAVCAVLSLALIASLAFAYQHWKRVNELDPAWVVPFSDLKVTDPLDGLATKVAGVQAAQEVEPEMMAWNVPQDTGNESMQGDLPMLTSPSLALWKKQSVTIRWIKKKRVKPTPKMAQEIKALSKMSNDHLAQLLAGCLDTGTVLLLYENCSRGSLEESVNDATSKFEWPLRFSYMQDIVRALHYIHSSPVRVHGRLSSACCFIDSRFTLKVSDVGLASFFDLNLAEYWVTKRRVDFYYRQFWTAPELLKAQEASWHQVVLCSQRQCDIYSFGIIMQEIILHAPPYSMYDDTFTDQRIYQSIISEPMPGRPSFRPLLEETAAHEDIIKLCEKCWAQQAGDRPTFNQIRVVMRDVIKNLGMGDRLNIMESLIAQMEEHTAYLQAVIEEKDMLIAVEKERSDFLLYSNLPQSVQSALTEGSSTPSPVYLEVCSVLMVDCLNFLPMLANSSASEAAAFLNQLHDHYAGLAADYDCCVIESLSQRLTVASGLPARNGILHARELSRLALAILFTSHLFRIPHRPKEILHLRLALHSGPSVFGVVGRRLPRFDLFGETMQINRRLLSVTKAGRIRLSAVTRNIIEAFGTFRVLESQEIYVKGKGRYKTFTLLGEGGNPEMMELEAAFRMVNPDADLHHQSQ